MKTWVKVVFTVSLVLNVLFIGFYLGTFTKDCNKKMYKKHQKKFDPELMAKLKEVRQASSEYIEDMYETRQKVYELLTAETFDPIAFEEVAGKLHQCRGEMMCNMTDKIKEIAMNMTQEERIELARIIKKHFQRKRTHWKKHS